MFYFQTSSSAFRHTFMALALFPLSVMLLSTGCKKYVTEDELQDELTKNSRAIYDSLSQVYNGVEIYSASSAGGDPNPPYETSSTIPYNGTHHYRSLQIPGGLNPGDKVFIVAELRLSRSGSVEKFVTPQSAVTITNSPNNHPDPGATKANLFNVAGHSNEQTWNLLEQYQTIDRSGMYTHASSSGRWDNVYVNFYARVYSGASLTTTFGVGAHSLSVIVVRA